MHTNAFLILSTFLSAASAQGVITSAQGTAGSPASLPLQVDLTKPDANIINATELAENVVNECGRTLLGGNIDIGENTETQLANKTVTSVTKGSKVAVTIAQVNADGQGPYTCDVDQTSNASGTSGQVSLNVDEQDGGDGTTTLTVTMPDDLACIGASTGAVCTVRCFNSVAAGPFGGCFAVTQTDITPNQNTAGTIATAQTLDGINSQILQNQKDLPAAIQANQDATTGTEAQQGLNAVDALLNIDSTAAATAGIPLASTPATNAGAATAKGSGKKGKGKNNAKDARSFVA